MSLCKARRHIIVTPPYKSTGPSENDCLLIWAQVFGIIAEELSILSDERMLESSKLLRKQQAVEFGELCDTGRKVEVSDIEFKWPDLPNQFITIQNRKNIRLGRCVHKDSGVQDPSVIIGGDFGFVGIFYQLARMDEMWIAGKVVQSTVQISTTPGALESFVESNSLALIWNYIVFVKKRNDTYAML
ncbi:hypothetical protein BGZ93_005949 [Podila epicladia]|nr:hypothetical protein BGZ92_004083 [Podila epicladia]KAG0095380.1 hypothetical protein BGZ93_005949 [Podila epicladia]